MDNIGKKIGIVVTLVLAVLLAAFIFKDKQQRNAKQQNIVDLRAEAKPLETQIIELRKELDNIKYNDQEVATEKPEVMLCFKSFDHDSYATLLEALKSYSVKSTLLVDTSISEDNRKAVISDAVSQGWDMMISGDMSMDGWEDAVSDIKADIESAGGKYTNIYFLNSEQATDENIKKLTDAGFAGYSPLTDNGESVLSGLDDNGIYRIEHVIIDGVENNMHERLELAKTVEKPLIIAMGDVFWAEGEETDQSDVPIDQIVIKRSTFIKVMDDLKTYTKDNEKTIMQVGEYLTERAGTVQSAESRKAEIDKKIDELQAQVDEIYSGLNK